MVAVLFNVYPFVLSVTVFDIDTLDPSPGTSLTTVILPPAVADAPDTAAE